jgi:hypothetical protein
VQLYQSKGTRVFDLAECSLFEVSVFEGQARAAVKRFGKARFHRGTEIAGTKGSIWSIKSVLRLLPGEGPKNSG